MKKIMFSREYGLEQAVLAGRKTQTRRVARLPDGLTRGDIWHPEMGIDDKGRVLFTFDRIDGKRLDLYPHYQPGEVLAVAQRYRDIPTDVLMKQRTDGKSDRWPFESLVRQSRGYDNKMFVAASLMPHQIRITDIGIEPIQDITGVDCRKEGIMEGEFMNTWDRYYYDRWGDVPDHITFRTQREAFASLIDRTSGRGTWQQNPWVWVYHFERVR